MPTPVIPSGFLNARRSTSDIRKATLVPTEASVGTDFQFQKRQDLPEWMAMSHSTVEQV
jgi:hypothetical protein